MTNAAWQIEDLLVDMGNVKKYSEKYYLYIKGICMSEIPQVEPIKQTADDAPVIDKSNFLKALEAFGDNLTIGDILAALQEAGLPTERVTAPTRGHGLSEPQSKGDVTANAPDYQAYRMTAPTRGHGFEETPAQADEPRQ